MGLFTEKIFLKSSGPQYVVEVQEIDLKKKNVIIEVQRGYTAVFNDDDSNPIMGESNKLPSKLFGKTAKVYLYPTSQKFETIAIQFHAGQYTLSLAARPEAKVKFAINGVANVRLRDYVAMARHFDRSITREEIEAELKSRFMQPFQSDVAISANSAITPDTTDQNVYTKLRQITADAVNSSTARTLLVRMGLTITEGDVVLRLATDETGRETIDEIIKKFNEHAIDSFDEEDRQRRRAERVDDEERERAHEINVITAERTTTGNTNTTSHVSYEGVAPTRGEAAGRAAPVKPGARYCPECGAEISNPRAKFCPDCGAKLE